MFISYTQIRVRYADVDQMGFVYYGNYATYYEVGRTDAMRELGTSYRIMEQKGVIMPVHSMNCRYYKPARYDDLLTIKTMVREAPTARMKFEYEIYNQNKELLNKGETTLAFVSKETDRPTRIPVWFNDMIKGYFGE